MAIAKSLRIPSNVLPSLFISGKKFRFDSFTLIASPVDHAVTARIAVMVSKKIDKRATIRNRIKRLFYAAVKKIIEQNKLKPEDIIIIASKTVINKTAQDLESELYLAFKKTGLVNDKKPTS